jgi:branched-chain amino acid transport system ATP-binding protein
MHADASLLLEVRDLRKSFGAVKATDGVNLQLRAGEIHALIGPNGAGKSTLITQLCGEVQPDAGAIILRGEDVTALPAYARARKGLARSFQITELCPDYTSQENLLLALVLKTGRAFQAWSNPRRDAALNIEAQDWLDKVGLSGRAAIRVRDLAHGEKRQLELAVALAREPGLLLLDEPMAGMGAEESARMTALLQELKRHYTILLVEHDMDAVFALADRITVLVYGKTIFTGTPDEVRRDAGVRAAYLGGDA